MSASADIERQIEQLLAAPLYQLEPAERHSALLALLRQEITYACERNPRIRNYVEHWPVDYLAADSIAHLPYLPVSVFKANPPLALVMDSEIKHTLSSSSTSGQTPSRVVLDGATARRMTKGVTTIIRNFIGPTRRPYMVIDIPENLTPQPELGARGLAIQGLASFATESVCCLRRNGREEPSLDLDKLLDCVEKWKKSDVLVYGFTYVIWTHLIQPLQRQKITLALPNVHILHSGGWKRLEQQAVTRDVFMREVASVFGCSPSRVIDYYGMVENVGVVYPDCERGNKHVPAFADVIIRDPLTLAPVKAGQQGLMQVCSVLPTSFPGFLMLTDDMAAVIGYDGCPCGRRGIHFRFARRVPKAEPRGCGNMESSRYSHRQEAAVHE